MSAEIGDIDQLEDYLGTNGSLADLKMFENMTPRVEGKIRELYKTLRQVDLPLPLGLVCLVLITFD
ncbi:hypothetical protein EGR_07997 [Echinococcus granulosus]|uniref:Uncharacterized protein n=1 Tax=Echinococcus granulosus TaxID=6210 RepID=W6U7B3_ECHGR|nr:hypothetical protein EGR_07997 [Echinococcus granulosus]EUB57113.1 hypothetical protein EGR_07997 [Echinococcus granulosus]